MPNNYTAISIGPIVKTLMQAKKTRHLWSASYLFSYIMKSIIQELVKSEDITMDNIILPFHKDLLAIEHLETGLYPDRLLINKKIDEQMLASVKDRVVQNLSKVKNYDFLKDYISIHTVQFELPFTKILDSIQNANPIFVATTLLDTLDLQERYINDISGIDWVQIFDQLNGNILYKDGFKKGDNWNFPSIEEIATGDFLRENEKKYAELSGKFPQDDSTQDATRTVNFYNSLKQSAKDFNNINLRTYHKYYAIVQADGDNVGKIIAKIGNDKGKLQIFSSALFQFAKDASKLIAESEGKAIYIGGDDLLFLAPIATTKIDKSTNHWIHSIVDIVVKLDQLFARAFEANEELKKLFEEYKVSLSYGISIGYVKQPLRETLSNAFDLMKEAKPEGAQRNNLKLKLKKHSGQSFSFMVHKSGNEYDKFKELVAKVPAEKNVLNSIIYKIVNNASLFKLLLAYPENLSNYFKDEFKEVLDASQNKAAVQDFLNKIMDYLVAVHKTNPENYSEQESDANERTDNIGKVYCTLRFLKHITDTDEENS